MSLIFHEKYRAHKLEAHLGKTMTLTCTDAVYVIPVVSQTTGLSKKRRVLLLCLVSSSYGWEHVSVTVRDERLRPELRIPFWTEMDLVKRFFWDAEDSVLQVHPAASQHVDLAHGCLHLWRPIAGYEPFELPPAVLVGGGSPSSSSAVESGDGKESTTQSAAGPAGQ